MLLRIHEDGIIKDITIPEGSMYLLPRSIPHNPVRYENTIGLVIEITRPEGQLDALIWYCDSCGQIVYKEEFYCVDLGKQLKPVIEKFAADVGLRTCKSCGFVNIAK
jgi:3-hydroxyanthranilate 3,4-dioxygenase